MNISNNYDVCVSGIGVISVFGDTVEDFFRGINRGNSFVRIFDQHMTKSKKIPVARAFFNDKMETVENRIIAMGCEAIAKALSDCNRISLPRNDRICLIVGSGMGVIDEYYYSPSKLGEKDYFSSLAYKLSERVGLNCDAVYIANACASGSQAISYGMDLLKSGRYDLVIAGGIDILSQAAYAGFLRLNAIDLDGCKPFDKNRKGISIGEGAVFFTMERRESVSSNIYCTLPGISVTCDAYHIVQMDPDAKAGIRAMDQALLQSRLSKLDVDLIVAHGTGTLQNDRIESKMINEFFGEHVKNIYVTAPKGTVGHTGGASGAFGVLVAIGAIKTGVIPYICNLKDMDTECNAMYVRDQSINYNVRVVMVNSFAFGGTNVVILCKKEDT